MKSVCFEYRRLRPDEVNLEAWFLFSTVSFAIACLVWLHLGLPWPRCVMRYTLGIPCPTCGATRCALAMFHGHFGAALAMNPFMCFVYLAIGAVDGYAATILFLRRKRWRVERCSRLLSSVLRVAVIVTFVGNWIYLICNYHPR